jgi:hypothetical protein
MLIDLTGNETRFGKIIYISPEKTQCKKQDVTETTKSSEIVSAEEINAILNLPTELQNRLYSHQKYGVQWLYGRYIQKSGGILGYCLLFTCDF